MATAIFEKPLDHAVAELNSNIFGGRVDYLCSASSSGSVSFNNVAGHYYKMYLVGYGPMWGNHNLPEGIDSKDVALIPKHVALQCGNQYARVYPPNSDWSMYFIISSGTITGAYMYIDSKPVWVFGIY